MKKSQLALSTYDARLTEMKITPKCLNTKVSYKLKLYDETLERTVDRKMCFEDVAAISFLMNYFDNPIRAEACGFYEIFGKDMKKELLENNFLSRRERFLFHGDYNYEPDDPHDLLNYRESIESVMEEIDQYHLYEQQTTGGTYLILAKRWRME